MCKLKELVVGKTVRIDPVLLKKAEQRVTRSNPPQNFLNLTLTDGETEIVAKLWGRTAEDLKVPVGSCMSAKIECVEYNGSKSYTVKGYGPAPDADPKDFVKKAPLPAEEMFSAIRSLTEAMPDDLKAVTSYLLDSNKEKLLAWHGAMTVHHAFRGGLLYHVFCMLQTGSVFADTYSLDKGLLHAGIILHDIGKLRELEMNEAADAASFAVDGYLFGHPLIGIMMVEEARYALGIEMTEKLRMLENIIASHHMIPEHGAIQRPATKEAVAVAMVDSADAKMQIFDQALKGVEPGKCSERQKFLDNGVAYQPLSCAEANPDTPQS